jgi:hypothetical protein
MDHWFRGWLVCVLHCVLVMSFESMEQALCTLGDYSEGVIHLYRCKCVETRDQMAKACLQLAIKHEERFQAGLREALGELSDKQRSAQFKWHDKWQLVNVPRLHACTVKDADDVVSLVLECDERARAYCAGLTASTNSAEILHVVERLEEARSQHAREYAWQVIRGG